MSKIQYSVRTTKGLDQLGRRFLASLPDSKITAQQASQHIEPQVVSLLRARIFSKIDSVLKGNPAMKKGLKIIPVGSAGNKAFQIQMTGDARHYAKILDEGGTIKARKGKYMTVPLDATMNSSGKKIKTPWDFPSNKTFLLKYKNGRRIDSKAEDDDYALLMLRGEYISGKGARDLNRDNMTPLFKLIKSRKIEATYWAKQALAEFARHDIPKIFKKERDRLKKDLQSKVKKSFKASKR